MKPTFFASPEAFREWLARHHASVAELWVGFWKVHTGKAGLTYPQAVEVALCFGWIDGIKKRYDDAAFVHRFTPRRPKSVWSAINVKRAEALREKGLMAEAGLEAFAAREAARTAIYSFENRPRGFDPGLETAFRARKRAWAFFEAQPPGYRRLATFWVMEAKREATRVRRLEHLMADSAHGERLAMIAGPPKGKR